MKSALFIAALATAIGVGLAIPESRAVTAGIVLLLACIRAIPSILR
jgi:hypothetical protein